MKVYTTETSSGQIEYSIRGKGIPIVFLHGGHSNCHDTLMHEGIDLEKFLLITPSRPGYGKTPLGNHQSPKAAAKLLVALIMNLKLNKVIVYGISAGGLTAIAMASYYPEIVNKLILASAVSKKWLSSKDSIYKTANIIFHPKVERFTWLAVRLFCKIMPRSMAKNFQSQFSLKSDKKIDRKDAEKLIEVLKKYHSGKGFLNDINQKTDHTNIEKVTCPVLIIHSQYDKSVSVIHANYTYEKIPGSTLEILKNEWGHMIWFGEEVKELHKKINQFIESNN